MKDNRNRTSSAMCQDCGHHKDQHAVEYPASDRWAVCYADGCSPHAFRASAICPNCGEQRPEEQQFMREYGRCFSCNERAAEMLGLESRD